jgi:hypothetical protein
VAFVADASEEEVYSPFFQYYIIAATESKERFLKRNCADEMVPELAGAVIRGSDQFLS